MEEFDPNDFGDDNVKIPMEFKKYPVDELSDIHTNYKDEYYDRFIKNAEKIFEKCDEDMECNPDNDLLYLEAEECDSKLNILHGHGGYICNKEGKQHTNNCKLKYCDSGYILNLKNNTCIEDPCEKYEINDDIKLDCYEDAFNFNVEPNQAYIFLINDKNNLNCTLSFYSEQENYFYTYDDSFGFKPVKNGSEFSSGNEIYTNIHLNDTENVNIIIKNKEEEYKENEKEENENEEKKKKMKMKNKKKKKKKMKKKKKKKKTKTKKKKKNQKTKQTNFIEQEKLVMDYQKQEQFQFQF